MAQSIKYIGPYGEEIGSAGATLNVMAELYDGSTLLARRMVQGFVTEADRDAKANAIFDGITKAEVVAAAPSTTGWKPSVAKAAVKVEAMEIG